jgi:hypothetical protein
MLCERDRSGYFETMARPGRTEPDSVSIWLKLSEEDAARMTQVLARPEFAGWTRAEWCLEMIQTALGYYTRPRPAAGPDRKQAPAAEPEAATEHAPAGEAVAEPAPVPDEPEPVLAAPEPEPEPAADEPESEADEPKRPAQAECPHPADARDYQSGTCAACGAILWD